MMEENRKGPGVFYAVMGVATLVVAIIGATFAFFSAQAELTDDSVDIEGGTNDDLGGALSLKVEKVYGAAEGDLVPAEFDATKTADITKALSQQCKDGNYTGCHVYRITADTEQNVNVANIYLELNGPATDKGNWKYLVFTGSETAANAITTAEATFKSTQVAVADGIRGTDIHTLNEKALTTDGQVYYVMVYLDNINAAQNANDTDETGSYTGNVSFYAAGGKVQATFTA